MWMYKSETTLEENLSEQYRELVEWNSLNIIE